MEDIDEQFDLTPEEEEKCRQAFEVFDRDHSGYIDTKKMRVVLDSMGYAERASDRQVQRLIEQADAENYGHLTLGQFKRMISKAKHSRKLQNEEETLDAFVAMGGQEDGSGHIQSQTLIHVIKNDFKMTIDVEQLIRDIDRDGSGQISYDEFRYLLSSCL